MGNFVFLVIWKLGGRFVFNQGSEDEGDVMQRVTLARPGKACEGCVSVGEQKLQFVLFLFFTHCFFGQKEHGTTIGHRQPLVPVCVGGGGAGTICSGPRGWDAESMVVGLLRVLS